MRREAVGHRCPHPGSRQKQESLLNEKARELICKGKNVTKKPSQRKKIVSYLELVALFQYE